MVSAPTMYVVDLTIPRRSALLQPVLENAAVISLTCTQYFLRWLDALPGAVGRGGVRIARAAVVLPGDVRGKGRDSRPLQVHSASATVRH